MATEPQPKLSYEEELKQKFGDMIDGLKLESLQKEYLKSRWLDQILWMEGRATQMRNWHRRLRLTTILASAAIPILVASNFNENKDWDKWIKLGTIGIGAIVTVSATIEEFYQYGDRWYSYRRSAELLKTQGWQFLQLSGSYRTYKTHTEALPIFTDQVETIIQRDVEVFTTEALKTQQQDEDNLPKFNPGHGG
jgi:Protein of unknown function (DUF4231)